MFGIELWMLKEYCRIYEIDVQEIDSTLTYWENMAHLKKFRVMSFNEKIEEEVKAFKPLEEEFNHDLVEQYAKYYEKYEEYLKHSVDFKNEPPIIQVVAYISRFIKGQMQIQVKAHPFNLALLHHYLIFRGTASELNKFLNVTRLPIRIVETRILNPEAVQIPPAQLSEPQPKPKTDAKLMKAFSEDRKNAKLTRWKLKKDALDRLGWEHHKLDNFDAEILRAIRH